MCLNRKVFSIITEGHHDTYVAFIGKKILLRLAKILSMFFLLSGVREKNEKSKRSSLC